MPDPVDYLSFLGRILSVNDEQLNASSQILESVNGTPSLVGKDPGGVAAAALYLTREKRTQSLVAEAGGVSTETVRQRAVQLKELIDDG